MNLILLTLYRIFVAPLVIVVLPLVAPLKRKLKLGLQLRKIRHEPLPVGLDPIWIHAASGEFEYAKPVIRQLKISHPDRPIVVTYFSPTFATGVTQFPGVDRAIALPLDLPGPCTSFLRQMHPCLLMVARTDLWPEMLYQCRRQKIPVVLFSYTQKAFHSPLKKWFTRWMLQWVQRIYCVAGTDSDHLQPLGLGAALEVMGDTRYDQVAYRLAHPKVISENLRPVGPCFVAGSTWPEDEAVILPGLAGLLLNKSLKLILVPHEPTPDHIKSIELQIARLGLSYALYSEARPWTAENILLVDQTGVLAELYAWGQFAFVGGSFRKSVHSVMEPLGAGLLTFVGPYFENNREAVEFKAIPFAGHYGVGVIYSHEELRDKMSLVLKDMPALKEFTAQLKLEFSRRQGASHRLVQSLKDLI